MPRGKKAARGNPNRGARGRGGSSNLRSSFVPFNGTPMGGSGPKGYSLQEEARNTERHTFWDSDQKLRHSKVNFVSAAEIDIPKQRVPETNNEEALAGMSLGFMTSEEEAQVEVVIRGLTGSLTKDASIAPPEAPIQLSPVGFFIDTIGELVNTGLPLLQRRSPSPAASDSSEEILLFTGRNNENKISKQQPIRVITDPVEVKIRKVDEMIHEREELLEESLNRDDSRIISNAGNISHEESPFEAILRRTEGKTLKEEEDDALTADYLQNIDDNDDSVGNLAFSKRELGGTEDAVWQDESGLSSAEDLLAPKTSSRGGWDRTDIQDFDDFSTSDGVMGEVQAIYSKRDRKNGIQYLVVWENQTVDEARWVPSSTLTSVVAMAHIANFEAEEKLVAEFQSNDKVESAESEETDDVDDDGEDDEQDLIQRKIDRMTDEQIARLLAKQEELGMEADELLLFDDATDRDDDKIFTAPKNNFDPLAFSSSRSGTKGAKRLRGDFPAASVLADAYDGFDVMDFDRPSIKNKPKGRKGKLVFDISDSELEGCMQMAWKNDRIKKKERKQEREELRSQGLLGSKNGKPNLKAKYKEGMGFPAIKEEIRNFLMGGNTTLALPPMDKSDRKIIHEIANAFNLKSKSAGTGSKRFPVLYRTARTSAYVERTYLAAEARLTRRFLPRMDVSSRSAGKRQARAGGGGFNNAGVSYRDGDIVGGSAPELGVENKGRAMLEKMGWSTGTALGALNNKGILQPVSHIVKTTKAGLG